LKGVEVAEHYPLKQGRRYWKALLLFSALLCGVV